MTKKLEELLNISPDEELLVSPATPTEQPVITLEEKLEEFDKIAAALPRVKGLGDISDAELDALAIKAEQAYDDLMDLGMNVEARYGARMFEVAAQMMNAAIVAKTKKISSSARFDLLITFDLFSCAFCAKQLEFCEHQ
jgi:hypothetical protein